MFLETSESFITNTLKGEVMKDEKEIYTVYTVVDGTLYLFQQVCGHAGMAVITTATIPEINSLYPEREFWTLTNRAMKAIQEGKIDGKQQLVELWQDINILP